MESATNGDMLKYVQRKGALTEPDIKKYFWQLCQAVRYCHNKNICHRLVPIFTKYQYLTYFTSVPIFNF